MTGDLKEELVPNFGKKPSPQGPASRRVPKSGNKLDTTNPATKETSAAAANPFRGSRTFQRVPKPPITGVVPVVRNDLRNSDLDVVSAASAKSQAGFLHKLKINRVVQACLAWL
jgi:hypothetical protein